MTELQRLLAQRAEAKKKLNELRAKHIRLGDKADRTDEENTERRAIGQQVADLYDEVREFDVMIGTLDPEPEPDPDPKGDGLTAEERELNALRAKVSVGRYLAAGIEGARLDGAEEEFRQAVSCSEGAIPLDAFEGDQVEERADAATAAPGTIGINMQGIVPSVFSQSAAAFLAIGMPRVPSGQYSIPRLTTDLTAAAKAKGDDQESTAAAFTVINAKPKRISARLSLRAEDLAEVGIPGFEASLRQNLRMVLADVLDQQLLRGTGAGANINGLAKQIAAGAAAGNVATLPTAAASLAGLIDGKFAHMLSDLRVINNTAVYAFLASTFAASDDSVTIAKWMMGEGIQSVANANMKASSNQNVGESIAVRAGGRAGRGGHGRGRAGMGRPDNP